MNADQCRAARALLRWTLDELASRSEISRTAIYSFEAGRRRPHKATIKVLRATFEDVGIEFIENGGHGVRLRTSE